MQNGNNILGPLLELAMDDASSFVNSLTAVKEADVGVGQEHRQRIIDLWEDGNGIYEAELLSGVSKFDAVDGANLHKEHESFVAIVAGAVRYSEDEGTSKAVLKNAIIPATYAAEKSSSILRVLAELELLRDVKRPTLLDGAFWSMLIECSLAATDIRDSDNTKGADGKLPIEIIDLIRGPLVEKNSWLLQLLTNPNVVAMSKASLSRTVSKALGLGRYVSDRRLMTKILFPGEYLRPFTMGPPGKQLSEHADSKIIFGNYPNLKDSPELQKVWNDKTWLSYYRPHPHKPCYRIEYYGPHENGYFGIEDESKFNEMLSRVYLSTSMPLIREPFEQFLVDKLAKGVSNAWKYYQSIGNTKFREMMGTNRTVEETIDYA